MNREYGLDQFTIKYEYEGHTYNTVVEACDSDQAIAIFQDENPDIEVKGCYSEYDSL